jgi:p-hydroxybenzoic acid efflux pump subunit AaeA
VASRDLAKLDLERTVIRAPADGWVTNLNVYSGEFITRGSTPVALVKHTFTSWPIWKRPNWKASVRAIVRKLPRWAAATIKGTVDSIAAGVTNASSSSDERDGLGGFQP